ncbi:MAG: RES domain-containing protein, partial [Myxococcaceae bacterium]
MLARPDLDQALRKVSLVSFEGTLCRAVHAATLFGFRRGTSYEPRPLYDLGPSRGGGRFTPRGGAPALYLAEDHETSLRELLQVGA